MKLLPGWDEHIKNAPAPGAEPCSVSDDCLPLLPEYFTGCSTFVEDDISAQQMLALARQRPLSHIGIDTEYQYSTPGVPLRKDTFYHDPTSVIPLLLSISLVEADQKKSTIYSFVLDLRQQGIPPAEPQTATRAATCPLRF